MILEICYDSSQGWLATGEPLRGVKGSAESLEELTFEQCGESSIELLRFGEMYVISSLRDGGGTLYRRSFYVANNENEAKAAFALELESCLEDLGAGMTKEGLASASEILKRYKDYSKRFLARKREITEEDVQLVAQQAGVSVEEARVALEQTEGDLTQAILLLCQRK